MTLYLQLSDELEARLREYAAAAEKNVASFVAEIINEKLSVLERKATQTKRRVRRNEKWLAEFDRWVASHPRLNHVADDSRESIYEGRGE